MPPLANVTHAPIVSPVASGGVKGQRPLPYPGYPDDTRLTARERLWWGRRFGIDTPYYVTPSGFGELIPLDLGTQGVRDVLVYDPATGKATALPRS